MSNITLNTTPAPDLHDATPKNGVGPIDSDDVAGRCHQRYRGHRRRSGIMAWTDDLLGEGVRKGYMEQGERLRRLREEAFMTVAELAEKSGVSPDTVSKIENGHRTGRGITMRRLAKALEADPSELLGDRRTRTPALRPVGGGAEGPSNREGLDEVVADAHAVMKELSRYGGDIEGAERDAAAGIHDTVRQLYRLYSWLDSEDEPQTALAPEERLVAAQIVTGTNVLLNTFLSRLDSEHR